MSGYAVVERVVAAYPLVAVAATAWLVWRCHRALGAVPAPRPVRLAPAPATEAEPVALVLAHYVKAGDGDATLAHFEDVRELLAKATGADPHRGRDYAGPCPGTIGGLRRRVHRAGYVGPWTGLHPWPDE